MRGINLQAARRELDLAAADAEEHELQVRTGRGLLKKRKRPRQGYVKAFAKSEASGGIGSRGPRKPR